MTDAIATVCLSGGLEQKLVAAAHAGFRMVEIFEPDFTASPLTARELRALLQDLGLTCGLWQPFRDFDGIQIFSGSSIVPMIASCFRLPHERSLC